jgi:hypothetical protein
LDPSATANRVVDAHQAHLEPPEALEPMVNLANQDLGDHPASPELHHHQSAIQLAPARAAPTDHPADLVHLAQPDPAARKDPLEAPAGSPALVATGHLAHLALLDSPVQLASLARLVHLERTDLLEPRVPTAHPDQPVQLDPRASADSPVPPATVELQEDLDLLDHPDQAETMDHLARAVDLAHLDHLAPTQSTAPAPAAHSSTKSRRPEQHRIQHPCDHPSGSALFYNFLENKLGASQFLSVLFTLTVLVNPKLALRSLN